MRATFPATARLHCPSEYTSALRGKRIAKGALFVVSAAGQAQPPTVGARLGLVIAKRYAAKSVTRNTIKRIIRESFRAKRAVLPANDFVFRLHSKVQAISLTQLKTQVRIEADALLHRASL